jgi:hypothetical protein
MLLRLDRAKKDKETAQAPHSLKMRVEETPIFQPKPFAPLPMPALQRQ